MTALGRALGLCAGFLWACAAAAEPFPARYDVTGVAPGDVLNLRAGPGTAHAIVGSLMPDATGVEVVGIEGGWARIGREEGVVHAAARFLSRQPGQDAADPATLLPLSCFGTEPFWSASLPEPGRIAFGFMGEDTLDFDIGSYTRSANDLRRSAFDAEGPDGRILGVLHRGACGDGMSDRDYGIGIDLLFQGPAGLDHLSGCCRLD